MAVIASAGIPLLCCLCNSLITFYIYANKNIYEQQLYYAYSSEFEDENLKWCIVGFFSAISAII